MKIRTFIAGNLALLLLLGLALSATGEPITYSARSGSKMRIEGTSNIHDWQVEGTLIMGFLQTDSSFPGEPGQACTPGKIEAKGEAAVPVRSLKSVEKDGKPYSDKMDEVMFEHLKVQEGPKNARIVFKINELTLKETAKAKDAPYEFEGKGDLTIAGVTKPVVFPIKVLPLGEKHLVKISGTCPIKMTDFSVEPPNPKFLPIHTGDDVKIIFDWMVAPKAPAK